MTAVTLTDEADGRGSATQTTRHLRSYLGYGSADPGKRSPGAGRRNRFFGRCGSQITWMMAPAAGRILALVMAIIGRKSGSPRHGDMARLAGLVWAALAAGEAHQLLVNGRPAQPGAAAGLWPVALPGGGFIPLIPCGAPCRLSGGSSGLPEHGGWNEWLFAPLAALDARWRWHFCGMRSTYFRPARSWRRRWRSWRC